jgi:hypothetical protein
MRKLYTIRYENEKEIKKSKGTQMSVVKKEIRTADYRRTLESGVSMQHAQMGFKTDCHQVYTTRIMKTSLSALDTKRHLMPDGITSFAYGHHAIGENAANL